jgi:hypothetical protein
MQIDMPPLPPCEHMQPLVAPAARHCVHEQQLPLPLGFNALPPVMPQLPPFWKFTLPSFKLIGSPPPEPQPHGLLPL